MPAATPKGRVQHVYKRFRGSRRQADHELAQLVVDQRTKPTLVGGDVEWGPKTTINDALEAWRRNGWEDLSPTTVRRYEGVWNTHIRDGIGRRAIATLSPYDVERYFRSLKREGLAEGSVRYARALLNRACKPARKWSGGVLPNPIADTELPKWMLADSTPVRAPEASEIKSLLRAAARLEEPRVTAFVRVVAATGMRRGEACALRWNDTDFESGIVVVDESVIAAKGGASLKAPKTRASIRRLVVDDDTLDMLRDLRLCQEGLAADCDLPTSEASFVFAFDPGGAKPPYPDGMSHAFSRVRTNAGVAADVHLHSLRHFQATVIDGVISERQKQARLGWSTAQMSRHYTDPVPDEDRRAAAHVGAALAMSEPPPDIRGAELAPQDAQTPGGPASH